MTQHLKNKNEKERETETPYDTILSEAAEWYVQSQEGLSATEESEFNRWKALSDQHANAWKELTATWGTLDTIAAHPNARTVLEHCEKEEKQQRLKWKVNAFAFLGFCLVLPSLWAIHNNYGLTYWLSDYSTARGEIEHLMLADGSQLTMNTTTSVNVDFSEKERRIILHRGEIFIDVAHDPDRPLLIVTESGAARALGTRFTVGHIRLANSSDVVMRVTVYESNVRVCETQNNACKNIAEQQQIDATPGQLTQVKTIKQSEPAWLLKQLSVRDKPLVEVLNELARYHQGVLYFDENELKHLRISGTLPLNNIPRALDALSLTLPIQTKQYTDWFITVSIKKE